MKNYFSHDEGARNDPKLVKVLMRLGQAGKGVYWDLVEMLYEQNGYLLLSECDSYAFALRTDCELINSLINDFNLFENDGERFWSNTALRRLEARELKSKKASESASKRWNNANAMRTHNEGNAIKEKKEKEIKSNKNKKKGENSNPNQNKELFEQARKLYPGTKLGAEVEWENFSKKYKEPDLPQTLLSAIQKQIDYRSDKKNKGEFVPEWKNFSTWINQKCWTEEVPVTPPPKNTPSKPRKTLEEIVREQNENNYA